MEHFPGIGRRLARLAILVAIVGPILAACGGGVGSSGVKRAAFTSEEFGVAVSPRVTKAKYPPRGGGRYLPNKPYVVRGKTYEPVAGPGYVARGTASWYGQDFHGRRTANGEIFGAYYLTAASPVLPVPSYARVTNLENGRSVLVRVNDRGPYLQGRVIDLSYQAASILGYVNKGSAEVEVRYVGPAPLHGDDTRMLMASVNKPTPVEQEQSRLALMADQPVAVAESDGDLFAGEAVVVDDGRINFADYQDAQHRKSRGSYSGQDFANDVLGLFGYAESAPQTAAEAAASAMAGGELA
ncbi:MAG TPA: septal ring lytic transglycosylase RlpA family protein, partial [Alphaproteobacteria bacterium]|nr:septal ring lytic transglycosylase RlpA family protein [Alphaproteobacteria bacterium]